MVHLWNSHRRTLLLNWWFLLKTYSWLFIILITVMGPDHIDLFHFVCLMWNYRLILLSASLLIVIIVQGWLISDYVCGLVGPLSRCFALSLDWSYWTNSRICCGWFASCAIWALPGSTRMAWLDCGWALGICITSPECRLWFCYIWKIGIKANKIPWTCQAGPTHNYLSQTNLWV